MRDLARRLLAAAVAIPLLWLLVVAPAPAPFAILVAAVSLAAVRETLGLLRRCGRAPSFGPVYAATVLFHAAALLEFHGPDWPGIVYAPVAAVTFLVLGTCLAGLARGVRRGAAGDMGATLLAALYAGWLASFLIRLRGLPGGPAWVLLALVLTWVNDTGAYVAGSAVGGPKLWPAVSPRKTWAGVSGGLAATLAVLAAWRGWAGGAGAGPAGLGTGLLIALAVSGCAAATAGDLAESLLKRAARVKDSGTFLPGHGGVLDKLDALLFTGPLVYFFALLAA